MHPAFFLHKKIKTLQTRPLVVGTLTGRENLKTQVRLARASSVDLIEVRLDTFLLPLDISAAVQISKHLLSQIKKMSRLPLLLTLRSHRESGSTISVRRRVSDSWRLQVLRDLLPFVDMVDVELSSGELVRKISPLARRNQVNLICSVHDFLGVPSVSVLQKFEKTSRTLHADVLKVATMPRTDQELRAFLRWGLDVRTPVALVGMGPIGTLTRILGYSFGSMMTYGHLGKIAAPGQMSVKDLSKSICRIYSPPRQGRGQGWG